MNHGKPGETEISRCRHFDSGSQSVFQSIHVKKVRTRPRPLSDPFVIPSVIYNISQTRLCRCWGYSEWDIYNAIWEAANSVFRVRVALFGSGG